MPLSRLLLMLILAATGVSAAGQPNIVVDPADIVEGQPLRVTISGLRPGQPVSLRASRLWSGFPTGNESYSASATFVADQSGAVDLGSSQPGPGSTYDNQDASGLFWSMRPSAVERDFE